MLFRSYIVSDLASNKSCRYIDVDIIVDENLFLLQEMEKLQLKGEVHEEELKALESDMTGKVGGYFPHSLAV